jgi:hypothetical protein
MCRQLERGKETESGYPLGLPYLRNFVPRMRGKSGLIGLADERRTRSCDDMFVFILHKPEWKDIFSIIASPIA